MWSIPQELMDQMKREEEKRMKEQEEAENAIDTVKKAMKGPPAGKSKSRYVDWVEMHRS
jgi:hypothetical protein